MTIVSCTEKPMTVNKAVRNNASISQPNNFPKIAAAPTITATSCSMAMIAVVMSTPSIPYKRDLEFEEEE